MDESIKQLGQDLALAGYVKSTRRMYLKTAEHLAARYRAPLAELTREQLRTYVEEITALGKSASWLTCQICALSFLYRKTLGQPERVSRWPVRLCLRRSARTRSNAPMNRSSLGSNARILGSNARILRSNARILRSNRRILGSDTHVLRPDTRIPGSSTRIPGSEPCPSDGHASKP